MKIVANLVLCAVAFAALADAKSMRRATSCDSGVPPAPVDQKPVTPGPSTPASSAPAPSAPATTAPVPSTPATTTPAPSTPATTTPAPSTPATTTPAPSTPAPTTPAPSTPAPSSAAPGEWDLSQGYADDCEGFVRVRQVGSTSPLLQTGCVLQFNWKHPKSFSDSTLVVDPGCLVCDGKFEDATAPNKIRLCNGKPFCPNFYHYFDVTQGDLLCVVKNNGTTSVEATGAGECALNDN